MKILKLSPYCDPEQVSSSHLTSDLNEAFIDAGFTIENYVPTPTRGVSKEVREKYKKIKYETEHDGKLIIHRFSMFGEGKNPIQRALRYVFVNIVQYIKGAHAKDIDVIFAGSTPPTQGLLCGLVKKRLKVPFVYNLQDVFPDSLVNAGMTKKGSLIWKLGRKIEDFSYRSADKIIVISNDFKRNIMEKGVPEEKIVVIPNWIDTEKVHPIPREANALFKELDLQEDIFYVVYAGNLGKAQGVQVLVDAAEQLKDKSDIRFLIFGNGVEEEKVKERIHALSLSNTSIYPLQPASRVSEVYSLGDVCVVSCKKGYGSNAFPSKTVSIMATATPIIASFDYKSELCSVLEQYNTGLYAEPENPKHLVDCILKLKANKDAAAQMGKNGRRLVEIQYSKSICTGQYICVMKDMVAQVSER